MGTHFKSGFTIIETMLVLAITGALVIGIFVGVGSQLNIQRYRDATESLKNLFQEQYSDLANVRNDRADDWTCYGAAQTDQSTSVVRGQSDCVLVGRLVTIVGSTIKQYTVVANPDTTPALNLTDIDSLQQNYVLNVSNVVTDEGELEWGAFIGQPAAGETSTSRSLAVLFIRSPDSGQIYTFSDNTVLATPSPASLLAMIRPGNVVPGQGEQIICVNANNPLFNDNLAIYMSPNAVGPSAFEVRSNEQWQALGSGIRC